MHWKRGKGLESLVLQFGDDVRVSAYWMSCYHHSKISNKTILYIQNR